MENNINYDELANKFMGIMFKIKKNHSHKQIADATMGEGMVLHYIYHNKSVIPREISEFMKSSSARVTATLNSLEKKGFIIRRIDSNDRRKIIVELTLEGNERVMEHHKEILKITTEMLKYLGPKDAIEHIRIMEKIALKE